MDYIEERFGKVDEVNILKLGDTHTGHPNYREDIVDKALKEIEQRPNGRIFIMGDLTEMALKRSVGDVYNQTMNPEEQIDYWFKKLSPYKDIIIGAVGSNHNERAVREVGMNPCRLLFKQLYGTEWDKKFFTYKVVVKYSFNKGALNDINWHGSRSSRNWRTILKFIWDMNKQIEADIYSMGHTHQLLFDDTRVKFVLDPRNMKIKKKRYYLVNTGSALGWHDGYPEQADREPVLLGFPILRLTGDRSNQKVEVDKITE